MCLWINAASVCISGEAQLELVHRIFPLYIPSEYFLCHKSHDDNLVQLMTRDDKDEGVEKLPDAARLVNIDSRRQPGEGLVAARASWALLQKGVEASGMASLRDHRRTHQRTLEPELQRLPVKQATQQSLAEMKVN